MSFQEKTIRWLRKVRYIIIRGPHTPPDTTEKATCLNCGTTFNGNFCPRCGQSRKVSNIKFNWFKFGNFYYFKGAYKRTLWELLYRPGYMMRDYLRGRRIIYVSPFKIAFKIIAIAVVLVSAIRFSVGIKYDNHGEMPTTTTNSKLAPNISSKIYRYQVFTNKIKDKEYKLSEDKNIGNVVKFFERKFDDDYTTTLLFFIPTLTLGCKIAMRKRRFEGRKLSYYEHLTIMTYVFIINVLLSVVFFILELPFGNPGRPNCPDGVLFAYAAWTYKSIYGWKWREALRPTLALLFYQLLILGLVIGSIAILVYIGASYI